jgi:tetratricopeptide (TPR) repeat protein
MATPRRASTPAAINYSPIPVRKNHGKAARWGIVAVCALAAVAIGIVAARMTGALAGRGDAAYGNLPPAFARALQSARDRAHGGGHSADDIRALAHLYHANRLYDEARASYELLAAEPGGLDAQDHYYLADIAQYQGDLDRAEAELRSVFRTAPDYLPARLALGNVLFKEGQAEDSKKEYTDVLASDADQPQAMFALAKIELLEGDDDAAVARLNALMSSHPEMTSGAGLFAQILDRRGDKVRMAEMTLVSRQRPEPEPADPWLDALLADCYDKQSLGLKFEEYYTCGEIDRAVPLLGRFEELDPKSPIPNLLRGVMQSRIHDDAGAVREYREALDKGGDPEKICPYIAQSMFALGQNSEAAELLARYYALKPDSIPILTAYADAAVKLGNTELARTLLAKVLDKEPYLVAQNMSLARILWTAGDRDQAAKYLEQAAKGTANDVLSRSFLAEYYLGKGDPLSAIAPLEQALASGNLQAATLQKLTAMLVAAYLLAGGAEEEKGHYDVAVSDYYEKAIRVAPGNPSGYARKARACARAGQFRGAADALEKLASLQARNPTVFLSLGDVRYQAGERDEARRDWQKALELAPDGDTLLREAISLRLTGPITEETFK